MKQIDLKDQYFGTEIEMTGISRYDAAVAIGRMFGTEPYHIRSYDSWCVKDSDGKTWKFSRDSSIDCERLANGTVIDADGDYSTEMVSPKLEYSEMGKLQEVVRCVKNAGAFVNSSCGMHIRLRSLGKHYSEESIRQWILQPKSTTPVGKDGTSRTPKKKLKGIQALYYSYLYQMGVLKQKPQRISPVLRADIRKLDARIEQMEFLQKHQITTREELLAYRIPLEEQVQALTKERKRLYRSEPDSVRIGQINEELKSLRKDIRICIRIEQQSKEMEEKMRLAEQIQRQAEQEENKTEKTRQKETESR